MAEDRAETVSYSQAKCAFHIDGRLRDIYILNTDLDDWQSFLDLVHRFSIKVEYLSGGEVRPLPMRVEGIFGGNRESQILILKPLSHLEVDCHFFCVDEIELSIDPRDVTDQFTLDAICLLMARLGRQIRKDVILVEENLREAVWLRYSHQTGMEFVG